MNQVVNVHTPTALWVATVTSTLVLAAASPSPGEEAGQAVYQQRCEICHDQPREQIPSKDVLGSRSRDQIVDVLTKGPMQMQAAGLSAAQINAVAAYLSASADSTSDDQPQFESPKLRANLCKKPAPRLRPSAGDWNGWSPDLANTRMQSHSDLRALDVPRLRPKWVFAYPGVSVYGPPSVVGGRVFLGTNAASVLSLDAATGCTYWATDPRLPVRTAVLVGAWPAAARLKGSQPRYAAYFGESDASVRAVNAETGEPIWSTKVDEHPFASIGESPKLYQGKLYVPIRSRESEVGNRRDYPCCTLRGGFAALDVVTGVLLWRAYTIPKEPKPFKINRAGTQMFGPAGASIWSPLTIDTKSEVIYGASAESRTDVPTDGADAIIAFDVRTGERRWVMQATANDNWTWGCEGEVHGPNCPDPVGRDADFASPPILCTLADGKRILIGAQKSGMVHAVDPDAAGEILWRRNIALYARIPPGVILRNHEQPGVVFGMATDAQKLYVAIADPETKPGHVPLGVYALDLYSGEIVWHTPGAAVPSCRWGTQGCTGAQRTAVTLIPGVAFAGSADGHIRAYATDNGAVIWDFDTASTFSAVNGVRAQGGSIEGAATVVAGATVYVMSGYGTYGGGIGNALIAFTVDGK
jgi:polyvinyl alcohol dehydrogenase (cytochrome)